MNAERAILTAIIQSREAFNKIEAHVQEGDLTEQGRVVFDHVRQYYDRDPGAASVDADLLARAVVRTLSSPKHQETFEGLIKALAAGGSSPANVVQDFIGVKLTAIGSQVATKLAGGAEPSDVLPLIEQYQEWAATSSLGDEDEEDVSVGIDLLDLAEDYDDANLIRMFPRALNERLDGGLLRGHHVLVFARPEMGKTLFLINSMYGFWRQGLKTLYVGNEEPIKTTKLRMATRLLGMTKYDVLSELETNSKRVGEMMGDQIVWAPLTPGTPREIEALCQEHNPDVLIVDQLRNLNMREDNFVRKLERAAQSMRQIGKRNNCLVISVTQAGDSATGKSVLDMGDVDNSNTGIPGAVDVMIGIGATGDDEAAGRRVLSLPKNKRGGDHSFFPVAIDPQTNKIRSLE